MIKASAVTLYLSTDTILILRGSRDESIDPTPTLAVAITKYLNAIASQIKPEITTLVLECNPHPLSERLTIILNADTHNLLLRATLSNPSLSLNSAVDILLRRFVPTIRNESLIVGTKRLEPLAEETYSVLGGSPAQQIKLEFGCLVPKRRESGKEYWYWRYYVGEERKDEYVKGNLDRVLAYVTRVKIPVKARPKRLNKSRKMWEIKVA